MNAFIAALVAADNTTITNKTRAIDAVFRTLVAHPDILDEDMSAAYLNDVITDCLRLAFPRFECSDGYVCLFIAHNAVKRGYLEKKTIEYLSTKGTMRTKTVYNFM